MSASAKVFFLHVYSRRKYTYTYTTGIQLEAIIIENTHDINHKTVMLLTTHIEPILQQFSSQASHPHQPVVQFPTSRTICI